MQVYSTGFFKPCLKLKLQLVRLSSKALSRSAAEVIRDQMVESDLLQQVVTFGSIDAR